MNGEKPTCSARNRTQPIPNHLLTHMPIRVGAHPRFPMRYLLAILLPPVAVFSTGRVLQGFINIILTLLGWIPGVVHASLIVMDYKNEQRTNRVIDAMRAGAA